MSKNIKWFSEIGIKDVAQVGGKNASLGEMYQNLTLQGVKVPNGFAITANAYKYVLDYNDAWQKLQKELDSIDIDNVESLQEHGKNCRDIQQQFKQYQRVTIDEELFGEDLFRD
jgi:pyruvate,water dikinase